jgi:hypothetical protein
VADGLDRATMLERHGGHYCRVLGIGLSSRAYLRSVDENLSDPAIVKSANAAGLDLAITLEPVEPMRSPVREPLTRGGDAHEVVSEPLRCPELPKVPSFIKGAS